MITIERAIHGKQKLIKRERGGKKGGNFLTVERGAEGDVLA